MMKMSTIQKPEGTILLAYRGSIAHGMYRPPEQKDGIDDIDLIGAVLAPPNCYLGLSEWGSRGTKEFKQGKFDCVYYEIKKLARLLLQGNPNVMSLLWLNSEHYLHVTPSANMLLHSRNLFTGKHVYNSFAGYAASQMKRMESRDPEELRIYMGVTDELKRRGRHPNHKGVEIDPPDDHPEEFRGWSDEKLLQRLRSYQKKGENIGYMGDKRKRLVIRNGYDSKNAAHLIRLLRMCKEFLLTGVMQVHRPDAAELLGIKLGEWPLEEVKRHAEHLFEECRIACDKSPLTDGPNREEVEQLVMDIVREGL